MTSGNGAGIWQSGAGLISDGPGTILFSTGNGGAPSTPRRATRRPANLGESVVRAARAGRRRAEGRPTSSPRSTPRTLDDWDADFASGGVTGLPTTYFGTAALPHLAVAVGKDGYVYLLNRDDLGGIGRGRGGGDKVVQRIGPYGGVWSRPGVWPGDGGWVYIPTASGGNRAGGSSGYLASTSTASTAPERRRCRCRRIRRRLRLRHRRARDHLRRHDLRLRARLDEWMPNGAGDGRAAARI